MKAVIYLITHIDSDKQYIGKRQLSKTKFLQSSYYGSGKYIRRAVKKHGFNAFQREILWSGKAKNSSNAEKYFIKKYNTIVPKGYNISEGGNGGRLTPEIHKKRGLKAAITRKLRKIKCSEKTKRYLSRLFKDIPLTEKHKKNISNSLFKKYRLGQIRTTTEYWQNKRNKEIDNMTYLMLMKFNTKQLENTLEFKRCRVKTLLKDGFNMTSFEWNKYVS